MRAICSLRRGALSNESGTSIVEATIILPAVLTLIAGIIQYGFLFSNYLSLKNASLVAARRAVLFSVRGDGTQLDVSSAEVLSAARGALSPSMEQNSLSVSSFQQDYGVTVNGVPFGEATRVELQYIMPLFFPFIVPQSNNDGTYSLRAASVMR